MRILFMSLVFLVGACQQGKERSYQPGQKSQPAPTMQIEENAQINEVNAEEEVVVEERENNTTSSLNSWDSDETRLRFRRLNTERFDGDCDFLDCDFEDEDLFDSIPEDEECNICDEDPIDPSTFATLRFLRLAAKLDAMLENPRIIRRLSTSNRLSITDLRRLKAALEAL